MASGDASPVGDALGLGLGCLDAPDSVNLHLEPPWQAALCDVLRDGLLNLASVADLDVPLQLAQVHCLLRPTAASEQKAACQSQGQSRDRPHCATLPGSGPMSGKKPRWASHAVSHGP